MKISKFEKLVSIGFKNRENFKHLSDYLVQTRTVGLDEERKMDVSADTALGMAIGMAMGKNRNLVTGMALGALGTGLAALGIKKIKDRIFTEEKVVEVNLGELEEVLETQLEIEKTKLANKE